MDNNRAVSPNSPISKEEFFDNTQSLLTCGLLLLRNIVDAGSFGGEVDGGGGLEGGFGDASQDSRLEPDSGSRVGFAVEDTSARGGGGGGVDLGLWKRLRR